MFIPTKAFLTKGVGRHKEKLTSFEMALRDAHLANFNLVRVSSIFPPHCELVDREEGMSMLKPGQIVFAVIAESATNEPSRLVAASIGVAMPADASHHGYISEHHSYGQSETVSGEYAEDLAASMLATVLGVPFEADKAWDERRDQWLLSGEIVRTMNVTSTAECGPDGRWTTVVSAVAFAFGRIRRLKPAGCTVAREPDFALLEKPPHPSAFLLADGRLDPMLMRGAQLHGFETSAFEHADDRFDVEILQRIVRDRAQMKARTGAWGREGSLCQGSGGSGSRGT